MLEDFEIDYALRQKAFNMVVNHFHPTYEIYYLIAGERQYFVKDRIFRLQAGDLVFINKYELHKTSVSGGPYHERVLINFNETFFSSTTAADQERLLLPFRIPNRLFRPNEEEARTVRQLIEQMLVEFRGDEPGQRLYLKALAAQLLLFCGRRMMDADTPETTAESPIDAKIYEIVDYLNEHYREPVSLSTISKQFYVSDSYLSRTFHKKTGFSFIEYLNTLRIREAQHLLSTTDDKVLAISEAVGFESLSQFGRVFRTVTGKTPLQFRRGAMG